MSARRPDSEDTLERATIDRFTSLGWRTINAYGETYGPQGTLGRDTRAEVVLLRELHPVLRWLNPGLPRAALDQAIEELTRDRSALGMTQANREIHTLLTQGVTVAYNGDDGEHQLETVRLIDWTTPANNDFLLVAQLWVAGDMYTRRADLVGFVNGLPLLFVELKAHTRNLKLAYDGNLGDYRRTIPQLFWYNGLIILSNGSDTRVGSVSAEWEHFAEWKRIDDSAPVGSVVSESGATYLPDHLIDLSKIDFAALQAKFEQGRKHTEVEKLKGRLNAKLRQMIRLNKSRMNYLDTFKQLIEDYNAGATQIDELWAQLFGLTQALSAEEERHVVEQLSEEELALFDLLTQPDVTLAKVEKEQVKQIARELLGALKREKLVLDWRKKQQARASIQVAIADRLAELPEAYDSTRYQQACTAVYQHIFENYASAAQNTYTRAA